MAARRKIRTKILEILYNLDFFNFYFNEKEIEKKIDGLLENNFDFEDIQYIKEKVFAIIKKREKLDNIIKEFLIEFDFDKTFILDRNILRISIYEILYEEDIPNKVSINEAIELAKEFGAERTYKFISGLLGSFYKEYFKEEREKELEKNVESKDKVGALAYFFDENKKKIKILMINNYFGKWTLPKGSYDKNCEDIDEALGQVMKEKYNLKGKVEDYLGENFYTADKLIDRVNKKIFYYLFKVENPHQTKVSKKTEGIKKFSWFKINEVELLNRYDDMNEIYKKGFELLKNKEKKYEIE